MKFLCGRHLALSSTALAALLVAGAPDAFAQTLLDLLFGGDRERRIERMPRERIQQETMRREPVELPRIKGPTFYEYKTDSLVEVDFSAIAPAETGSNADLGAELDAETVGSTLTKSAGDPSLQEVRMEPSGETAGQDSQPLSKIGSETGAEKIAAPAPGSLSAKAIAGLQEYELLAEKEAAEAIVRHYSAQPEFIWVEDGSPNDRARAALKVLADAHSHALDPADYAVDVPDAPATDAELARFEMELSARVLRYARDARSGRVDPNRISGYHHFAPEPLDMVAVLHQARTRDDVAVFLEAQHPDNEQYKKLRVELETLRASDENEIVIAPDTLIRPGQSNAEFPKILTLISQKADAAFREAHGEVLTRHLGSEAYAQELVPVIKAAQRANGLGDDGVIGPRTIRALAGVSRASRIAKVETALERLRWLPSELGERYVFLNAPAFSAVYVEDGEQKLAMRAIYGQKSTQTYFFQDEIEYVQFHPYWGLPRSIIVNEYLPKLRKDPSYFDRAGFEVTNRQGQKVASASIDWWRYGADIPFDVRQLPGPSNALGELKILFPNKHAIYMHDTPAKGLFSRDMRALSHGCVRLQEPRAMAAAVLGWSKEDVAARLEQPHSRADLPTQIPVYVAYFTAWPDQTGAIGYHNDIYDRDARIREALDKINGLRSPSI